MEKRDGFIPKEDIEFERQLREQEQAEEAERKKLEEERAEREERERAEYEKNLQDRKIELMKLRQGVIESSDVVKEVHEEPPKLTVKDKLAGAWYRSKWLILFVAAMVLIFGYIFYDMLTAEKIDYTVLVVSSNPGFYSRTAEIEEFFEKYCDDKNGDGKVAVMIYNISTDTTDPNAASSAQAQLMSQLMTGDNVMLLSDETTDFELINFCGDYPGDPNITPLGLLLNCEYVREEIKWQAMPETTYLGIRQPTKLLSTPEEVMRQNVADAMPIFEKIKADVDSSASQ